MDTEVITKELQKFNTTDAAIATMRQNYMGLTVKDLDDREGYEKIHIARMDCKQKRVQVTKKGKELREDAVKFQKAVIAEEKRIIDQIIPIEDHLTDEETRIDEEKERIKAEAAAKEVARIQARVNRLFALGCRFDGTLYSYDDLFVPQAQIGTLDDARFGDICTAIEKLTAEKERRRIEEQALILKVQQEQEAERQHLAEEAARIKAEQGRIEAEQEKERQRLAAESKAIQDEKDRLAREKKAAEDATLKVEQDKLRAIEMETAKAEAAEKARLAEIERVRLEAEEKIRKEEKARIAAERKAQRRPDKEKLLEYARAITDIPQPSLKHDEFIALLATTTGEISQVLADLNKRLEEM